VRSFLLQGLMQRPPPLLRKPLMLLPDKRMYQLLILLANLNSSPATRPPLPEHLRAKLAQEFEGEVESLGMLLERDLSHWVAR
jgi:hypothetical protein